MVYNDREIIIDPDYEGGTEPHRSQYLGVTAQIGKALQSSHTDNYTWQLYQQPLLLPESLEIYLSVLQHFCASRV